MDALAEKAMALATHLRHTGAGRLDESWHADLAYLGEALFNEVQALKVCGDQLNDWVAQIRADLGAEDRYADESAWLAVLREDANGLLSALGLTEGNTPSAPTYR